MLPDRPSFSPKLGLTEEAQNNTITSKSSPLNLNFQTNLKHSKTTNTSTPKNSPTRYGSPLLLPSSPPLLPPSPSLRQYLQLGLHLGLDVRDRERAERQMEREKREEKVLKQFVRKVEGSGEEQEDSRNF